MYNVEKRSAVLANAAGFARLDAHEIDEYTYIYGPVAKWRHWDMFIHWGNKLRIATPERCTDQNATSARFLEVQIPLCVLVYD